MVYPTDQVNDLVTEYVRITAKTVPEIEEVWLFGSYAEQRAKDESDIDLAIVSPLFGEDYPKALSLVCRALWELSGVPSIHVHGFTRQDFQTDMLAEEVRRSGRKVFDGCRFLSPDASVLER